LTEKVLPDDLWDEIASLFPPDAARTKSGRSSIYYQYVQHV
jgi:hypothetical protein